MQFKIARIRYTKEITARVLVPADMDDAVLHHIAEQEALDGLRHYDDAEWAVELARAEIVEIAPEQLRFVTVGEGRYAFRRPAPVVFDDGMLGVVSDDHEQFVSAEDAKWWQLDDEQLVEWKQKERLLQDIHHPDQMHLFVGASK